MSEGVTWEALAEIFLIHPNASTSEDLIFCLCSRVFIKNLDVDNIVAFDKEEISENDEVFVESHIEDQANYEEKMVANATVAFRTTKRSQEEPESCYHTDHNYYSTDEHEHNILHAVAALHSSDSGADISEQHFSKIIGSKDSDFFKIEEAEAGLGAHHRERNNSLPNIFGNNEFLESWEKYWGKNGEQLVWASWIETYSDYINPEYLESQNTPACSNAMELLFDFGKCESVAAANMDIVISESSPVATAVVEPFDVFGDGWNPLVEETDLCCPQKDQPRTADCLLSPRCESVNSSIPITIGGTTDSMTNVTHMTISSYEFGSSKVTSETSNSISSPDDDSSNNSETQIINSEYCHSDYAENAMDVDQYWQTLWQQHFQEQYAKHYAAFMRAHHHFQDDMSSSFKSESGGAKHRNLFHLKKNKSANKALRKKSIGKKVTSEILPKLVANMKIMNAQSHKKLLATTDETDGATPCVDSDDKNTCDGQAPTTPYGSCTRNMEANEMAAFGLPTSFGRQKRGHKNSGDGNRPPNDRQIPLKRSHESDTETSNLERLKNAFELMGYAFTDLKKDDLETKMSITGEVVYRKKHIRLHNRALKMKYAKPKHIFFDEEGNEVVRSDENHQKNISMMHSSSDDDDDNTTTVAPRLAVANLLTASIASVDEIKSASGGPSSSATKPTPQTMDIEDASKRSVEVAPANAGENVTKKEKKKKRKNKLASNLPVEIASDKTLLKYWYKRFSLFSLFDLGVKLDRESWFSVTPQKVAMHTADRLKSDLIIDAFCGCGGNTIQFANTCKRVIAIDIDPKKIEMAKHNAAIYGVAQRIEFIVGDFFQLAQQFKADCVFLSPPWGGPEYMKDDVYDVEKSLQPVAASELMRISKQITQNVAMYLPRNSNCEQLTLLAGPQGKVEIEQNFLDRKLVALTAYYGNLINEQ